MEPRDIARLAEVVQNLCPEAGLQLVGEFLSRMDERYLSVHSAAEIALHVGMASSLGATKRCAVTVHDAKRGRSLVTVVAYDYFAEFSLLCGLLSSHGLAIEAGWVHTFSPLHRPVVVERRRSHPRTARTPSRKIVDVFRVLPREGAAVPKATTLEEELEPLLVLLSEGRTDEAREGLNRRLVGSLGRSPSRALGGFPIDISFENTQESPWTTMRVTGRDTPAFLYSIANALAMRGVYVSGVGIENVGDEVRDELLIAKVGGGRIEGEPEQHTLRLAVALIKQFTYFLPFAPDPARALHHFDQLLDRVMTAGAGDEALVVLKGPEGFRLLARVLGSSDFLWEDFLRAHFEQLSGILKEFSAPFPETRVGARARLRSALEAAPDVEGRIAALNEFKDREIFVLDMKRLLDAKVSLEEFSLALTSLAEDVLGEAFRLAREPLAAVHGTPTLPSGEPCPVALLALGKFGGREIGYASDLELVVVYGEEGSTDKSGLGNGEFFERCVQDLAKIIKTREDGIFHVDLRLRPHGNKGPLATPFASFRSYYLSGGDAHPFERQALIKLRFAGGDARLGSLVEGFRDDYVWSAEPWDLPSVLHLRDRQVRELVAPGAFNVKYSPGGLVEVEYSVQYLQLLHGRERPEVRTPSTHEALRRLYTAGLLNEDEHRDLEGAYLFWRRVTDALRMVRGNAGDLLLPERESFEYPFLARRLGYGGPDYASASAALAADVERHRNRVSRLFTARFREGLPAT